MLDLDDDGEEFFEIEDGMPVLDVRAITRVCYTRGFVSKVSHLRSGRDVQVTEWEAPRIPQAVLDSVEREAVDLLVGEWGDPKAGDPMQVDVIDLETDEDLISIELFNRAIGLSHEDSEEVRRIHRVCEVLEVAAAGGPDRADEAPDGTARVVAVTAPNQSAPPSAAVDLSGA